MNIDDLELELRRLPGVRAAGFSEGEEVLLVQVQVTGNGPPNLPLQATRIAYRHSERPVAVELVRWKAMPTGTERTPASAPTPAPEPPEQPRRPEVPRPEAPPVFEAAAPPASDVAAPAPAFEVAAPTPTHETPPPPSTFEAPPAPGTTGASEGPAGDGASEPRWDTEAPPGREPRPTPPAASARPSSSPWRAPRLRDQRVRLLAVLTFPDTNELEVHLTHAGRRIIGRSTATDGMFGAVEATVDGLRVFAPDLDVVPTWAQPLNRDNARTSYIVACGLRTGEGAPRHGIAQGASPIEAAARAALHALNRTLVPHLGEAEPVA